MIIAILLYLLPVLYSIEFFKIPKFFSYILPFESNLHISHFIVL